MSDATDPPAAAVAQESYIVNEGKKRGSTRDVRAEAGEAWGALIESDQRAYYTAGGRVWVLDLEPSAGKKKRLPGAGSGKK